MHENAEASGLKRFVALDERHAPTLLVRLFRCDQPVDVRRSSVRTRLSAHRGVQVPDLAARSLIAGPSFDAGESGYRLDLLGTGRVLVRISASAEEK